MAEKSELDAQIARLEAALGAATEALGAVQATPDQGDALGAAQSDLQDARQTIATLEQQAKDREAALNQAAARAEAAETSPPEAGEGGEAEALRAQIAELRAARAQDLAEMKALLKELEPILESVDA